MNLSIEITREDYADFNKFHFLKNRLKRTILTGCLAILAIEYMINDEEFEPISSIIGVVLFAGVYIFLIQRQLNKTKKIPMDNGTILGLKQMHFTEEGILATSKDADSRINWSGVKKLEESKTAYYLYIDKTVAFVIPKRYFESEVQEKEFAQMVKSKINATR